MICSHCATLRDAQLQIDGVGITNVYCFKKDATQGVKSKLSPTKSAEERIDDAILCLQCRHRITSDKCRIEVNQCHQHAFTNPAQVRFIIGCFSDAPGCSGVDEFTSEFTWFSGYQWQVIVCSRCGEHLGWKFQSIDHRFYGLILNRLLRFNP